VTTKTEAANAVRKILESVKAYLADPSSPKIIEAGTRAYFIDPLLRALGYDAIGDIEFEVYLPDPKQHLDYQLRVDGKARVAVEAKAIDVKITGQHIAQVIQYCAILNTEWAVVTNAREWHLYRASTWGSDRHILTADLVSWQTDAEFEAVFNQLWLVSKEAFLTSEGPASWLIAKQLDSELRLALSEPGAPAVKLLRKQLSDKGVQVSAGQVAAWLDAHLSPESAVVTPSAPPHVAHEVVPLAPHAGPSDVSPEVSPGSRRWLIPAAPKEGLTSLEHLELWLAKGFWGFWEKTPSRKQVHAGDSVAFYASSEHAVVAHATVSGEPNQMLNALEWPEPQTTPEPAYKVPLSDIAWLSEPVVVDQSLRAKLDAFRGRNPAMKAWGFFVQSTRSLTEADFKKLTRQA
jgi:hypothetical protein